MVGKEDTNRLPSTQKPRRVPGVSNPTAGQAGPRRPIKSSSQLLQLSYYNNYNYYNNNNYYYYYYYYYYYGVPSGAQPPDFNRQIPDALPDRIRYRELGGTRARGGDSFASGVGVGTRPALGLCFGMDDAPSGLC